MGALHRDCIRADLEGASRNLRTHQRQPTHQDQRPRDPRCREAISLDFTLKLAALDKSAAFLICMRRRLNSSRIAFNSPAEMRNAKRSASARLIEASASVTVRIG